MLRFTPQLKLAATAWACLAILTTTAAIENTAQAADKPVHIGNRVEPFVDTYLIDRFEGGAKLQLHKPVDRDVAIVHDAPWEGNTSCYHTIFQDGDLYRLYYRGHHVSKYDAMGGADHKEFICYAESKDGIIWVKPKLGIVEFNGSKDNNIVWAGPHGTHNFAPFKDANPKAKPDEQYKAMGTGKGGQFIFKSPDGIHWQLMHDKPVITEGAFDSLNIAYYDAVRKRYVDFHRDFQNGVRDIKTATSDDFFTWTDPDWITYPGVPAEHLYTNGITPYFRAPHIFIGLPKRLVPGPNPAKHAYGGVSDAVFMTSRDGVVFSRWTEAIVRPGLQASRWVNRNNMPAWGIVETKSSMPGTPNEVSIYTTEDYYQGSGTALRRHTYRLDGFVSINAPLSGGEAVTKSIVFAGAAKSAAKPAIEAQRGEMELTLNMSTSAAGSIQVALLDAEGKAIPGYGFNDCDTLIGDGVNIPVSWSGNTELNQLAGTPIRVHFRLKDADIYAMQFGNDADNLGDVLVAAVGEDSAASKSLELLSVKKIYDHAPHNAFTDLIRFNGQWVCGFRASPAHAGGIQGAKMQILVSDDADRWTSVAALDDDRGDIRDAKFGIMPDGRLMMLTAIQQFDTSKQMHQSLVWLTNDLKTWDGPYDVADPDVWTWGIQWHKGVGYSIGYGTVKRFVRLFTTKNGTEMDTHVSNLEVDSDYPNESSIVFAEDDTAYCLLRCTGPAQFGIAKPPYKDWQWKKIGVPVGGPKMIQLADGRLIGGGRLYDGGARTSLFWIDRDTGALTEILKLPSGGDTSYPGMVLHEGILHVSYYSSHEGKASVYLAKLKIAEKTN